MEKNVEHLISELKALDNEMVEIDGTHLKPSQCFHFEADPAHILFNTNCPDQLKQKVQGIISKHIPDYETGSPQ